MVKIYFLKLERRDVSLGYFAVYARNYVPQDIKRLTRGLASPSEVPGLPGLRGVFVGRAGSFGDSGQPGTLAQFTFSQDSRRAKLLSFVDRRSDESKASP